ncbi:MAG: hypothetical protein MI741_08270, partial [Rhodospirillales bacterium]|nr:hypothetical protein [Rhodospirillales bacterium]
GRFDSARDRAEKSFARKERYAEKLYLLGLAQLHLADQTGKAEDYKDAALTLMRVDVHYPLDPIRDFALLEVAYSHLKFGRTDIARKLLAEVQDRGRVTPENNPEYHKRMQEIAAQVSSASAGNS